MSTIIAPLAYTGSIDMWALMTTAETLLIELNDYYKKQTLRNRTHIHGANGRLLLSIPIKHLRKTAHQYYKEVEIENSFAWQKQHWKSIQSAYRSSPYFEFYEDDISIFYKNKFSLLYDLNKSYFELLLKLLGWKPKVHYTKTYESKFISNDIRSQIEKKEVKNTLTLKYTQVFENKNGFIPNLSILDLLFNEGPNSLSLLKNMV